MGNNNISEKEKEELAKKDNIKQEGNLDNIKSKYILKKIFGNLNTKKLLKIIRYNIKNQNRLGINIKNYIEFFETKTAIEIEIIPQKNQFGKFINISNKEDELYFHIYFNNNIEEVKKYDITQKDNVQTIKIIIDYQIKSFSKLFYRCKCIESISFKKFSRNDITDISYMFYNCSLLKNINIYNINTNNVIDMSHMFNGCNSLIKLDLSNFNTNKVNNMSYMFCYCNSLKELNISNFNTKNVANMDSMFSGCSSIEYIPVYNFDTNNVENMSFMFYECLSLKDIDISNFNTNKVTNMESMFYGCTNELMVKIKTLNNKFKIEAFQEYDLELLDLY